MHTSHPFPRPRFSLCPIVPKTLYFTFVVRSLDPHFMVGYGTPPSTLINQIIAITYLEGDQSKLYLQWN